MRMRKILGGATVLLVAAAAAVTVSGTAGAIVGGERAAEAPSSMGSLQGQATSGEYSHGCGTSLIAPEWAVTARHCVIQGANTPDVVLDQNIDPALLQVRFGSNDSTEGGTVTGVAEIRKPKANPIPTAGTDIALLRLAMPVANAPVRIAAEAGTGPTRILGWGMDCAGGQCELPTRLNQLDTKTLGPETDCAGLAIHFTVESCIGEWNTGRGAHFGDSGGPSVRQVDGEWQLTGATSRVMNAGNAPTIYVDVPAWRQWIRETTGIDTL